MQWIAGAILVFGLGALILLVGPHWRESSASGAANTSVTGPARVFLVLPDDGGRHGALVGCGDSLVAFSPPAAGGTDPLMTSVRALLAMPALPAQPAGSYNALGHSALRVASISVGAGVATVALVGELRLGGVCDGPRVKAQLLATITQFPQVRSARITINGRPLETVLSLRG